MTDYIWQLGIDWNAIQTGGVGYLRGGLGTEVTADGATTFVPSSSTNPVQHNDQITFRIFDVSSSVPAGRRVAAIASFGIDSQTAVEGQLPESPLNKTHPMIVSSTASGQSSLFENSYFSWDLEPVTVIATPGRRFLLTVYLQAIGPGNVLRLFNHDPEMVVGGAGG